MKQKSNSSIETPYFQGRKPTQIGLVVEDVEKAARAYSQFFGLGALPIHITEPQEIGWTPAGDNTLIMASEHNHGCFLTFDLARPYTLAELIDNIISIASVG